MLRASSELTKYRKCVILIYYRYISLIDKQVTMLLIITPFCINCKQSEKKVTKEIEDILKSPVERVCIFFFTFMEDNKSILYIIFFTTLQT